MEGSPKTAIVCDSTCYLPPELWAATGAEQISLYVTLAGDQRRESEIDDYGAFFERLRTSEEGATTSQPSIGDFIAVYRPLLDAGREIVSIHISAGISGTYESALQARQQLVSEGAGGERVHIVDSRTSAGAMGLLVLAASNSAKRGEGPEAILARIEHLRGQMKIWFAIDTLEYLRRGGRIGPARAWLGSALQIKPILTLEDEITPVERVRTRRRAFERLVEFGRELEAEGRDGWVVQHIQDPENAERLVAEGRELFGSEPVFVSEIGPVLGAHTGPGLLGIGGVPRELLG